MHNPQDPDADPLPALKPLLKLALSQPEEAGPTPAPLFPEGPVCATPWSGPQQQLLIKDAVYQVVLMLSFHRTPVVARQLRLMQLWFHHKRFTSSLELSLSLRQWGLFPLMERHCQASFKRRRNVPLLESSLLPLGEAGDEM